MYRPTKRQRLESPPSWMDCETLSNVPSPFAGAIVSTDMASQLTKEIFMERFQKEIIDRFHFSMSSQLTVDEGMTVEDAKRRRQLLRQRIPVGMNACTRVLEAACAGKGPAPTLIVVAGDGLAIPTMLTHVPVIAQRLQVPLLLLPGQATSAELGRCLGLRKATILCFQPSSGCQGYRGNTSIRMEAEIHAAVHSFVDFMRTKVPVGETCDVMMCN